MTSTSLRQSFRCAFAGLRYAIARGRSAKIHLVAALLAGCVGVFLNLPATDWAILVLTVGTVIAAEVVNTSIESLVDLASPETHELARIAKDTAAGAVLVLAIAAVAIGLLILGPPLYERMIGFTSW